MTNRELQEAIDSIFNFIANVGGSSEIRSRLHSLMDEQVKRSKVQEQSSAKTMKVDW